MLNPKRAKNLIIFGAGASYGSDDSETPPPTAQLTQELIQFDPTGWGNLKKVEIEKFQSDFELAMSNLNPLVIAPLQRSMAKYFFKFTPKNTNLYVKLAQLIKTHKNNITLISFNYERLLEISFNSQGLALQLSPSEGNADCIEFCLPHGCCHLFCEGARFGSALKINGFTNQTQGQLIAITDPNQFIERINSEVLPPVMSYFEPLKRTTSGVDFIEGQRLWYQKLIMEAQRIIIIGLKVRTHDKHIWDPLKETNAALKFCSGPNEGEIFKEWARSTSCSQKPMVIPKYFKEGFDEICSLLI